MILETIWPAWLFIKCFDIIALYYYDFPSSSLQKISDSTALYLLPSKCLENTGPNFFNLSFQLNIQIESAI